MSSIGPGWLARNSIPIVASSSPSIPTQGASGEPEAGCAAIVISKSVKRGRMDIVIFAFLFGVSVLVTGFSIAGIRFVETAERCSHRNVFARLMMSMIAWREVQARRVIGRYHAADRDPLETYPYLPGQAGLPGGERPDVAAGVTEKSADSCRPAADRALYKPAKSDEIKHRGNARRLDLVPVYTLPILAGVILPEPLQSE